MSERHYPWDYLTPRAIRLVLFLDEQEDSYFEGVTRLIATLEWHESSMYRVLRDLEHLSLIEREKKGGTVGHRLTEKGEKVASLLRKLESYL